MLAAPILFSGMASAAMASGVECRCVSAQIVKPPSGAANIFVRRTFVVLTGKSCRDDFVSGKRNREMLSETLTTGLEAYRIGPKIRDLRLKKSMGLVQLGSHTGLSPGMLSKIERGQLFPTLPTLLRVALVFGVWLEHFFADTPAPAMAVVRKKERLRLPDRPETESPSYYFESLDFPVTDRKMEAYHAEFPRGGHASEPHLHAGAELIYILKGQVVVSAEGNDVILEEGDAMYFDSSVPHAYRQKGRATASAIVVVTPG
jgi:transcriptional regulator with XRE-family HTH domain